MVTYLTDVKEVDHSWPAENGAPEIIVECWHWQLMYVMISVYGLGLFYRIVKLKMDVYIEHLSVHQSLQTDSPQTAWAYRHPEQMASVLTIASLTHLTALFAFSRCVLLRWGVGESPVWLEYKPPRCPPLGSWLDVKVRSYGSTWCLW